LFYQLSRNGLQHGTVNPVQYRQLTGTQNIYTPIRSTPSDNEGKEKQPHVIALYETVSFLNALAL
jgi:hypothetical protein